MLFEHECFACPLSLVAEVAIEQEEELMEEEREAQKHQLECEFVTWKESVPPLVLFWLTKTKINFSYT